MPSSEIRTCESCYDEFDYLATGTYTECGEYRCGDCTGCGCCDCDSCDGCSDCRSFRGEDDCDSDHRVHNYSYRPYPFNMKGEGTVHFGLELEVGQNEHDIANAVGYVDDSEFHLYLKEDGSITGAEIVTHPMTLDWARNWDKFDTLLTQLKWSGCSVEDYHTGYDTQQYGLHVHIARDAFIRPGGKGKRSTYHQMSWLLFISRNTRQIQRLARRFDSRWARFNPTQPGELKSKAQNRVRFGEGRYVAVNCAPDHTYELRFFAATLEPVELWAALEFADASVEYTRQIKSSDALRNRALRWPAFTGWVADSGRYHNLESQFITHSITN